MWATDSDLKVGTQVVYVPTHADGDSEHPDCEEGFITSVQPGFAFCRYWSKTHGGLRTLANSERTPICALVVKATHPQSQVDSFLAREGYI